jgi:hypothetical protein
VRSLCLLLVACTPHVNVDRVDALAAEVVLELVDDAEADGSRVVRFAHPGVTVIVDSAWLSEYNRTHPGACATGHFDGSVIRIASTTEFVWCDDDSETKLSRAGQKLVIAHELGHAGGIVEHAPHGIMAQGAPQYECLHRETRCLADALAR